MRIHLCAVGTRGLSAAAPVAPRCYPQLTVSTRECYGLSFAHGQFFVAVRYFLITSRYCFCDVS